MAAELTAGSLSPEGAVARWFVAYVKPRQEEAVCWRLRLRGIATFLPRLLVQRRHGSRRWEAVEPLFPGYMFLQTTGDPAALYRARWTPGVKRLLGAEEDPTPVEDEVLAYLRERMGDRGYIVPRRELVPGTRVRFREGPFALLEGVIDRPASRAERVRVLLRLCGVVVPVEVRLEELEPV